MITVFMFAVAALGFYFLGVEIGFEQPRAYRLPQDYPIKTMWPLIWNSSHIPTANSGLYKRAIMIEHAG